MAEYVYQAVKIMHAPVQMDSQVLIVILKRSTQQFSRIQRFSQMNKA